MKKRKKKKAVKTAQRLSDRKMAEIQDMYYPITEGRKRPRSQAKFDHFKDLDERTGKKWGDVSSHVPVSEINRGAGTWGLDKSGREIMWFPNSEGKRTT